MKCCELKPSHATLFCHECRLISVTMPLEKAQLYADLYKDYESAKQPEEEWHLVNVGGMLLRKPGRGPTLSVASRIKLWLCKVIWGGDLSRLYEAVNQSVLGGEQ
tara:strand:+ start:561 stop:875 length:315 start_codon:yes stop_codon:yes gene_type:complete